jgi:hypothetical protein
MRKASSTPPGLAAFRYLIEAGLEAEARAMLEGGIT